MQSNKPREIVLISDLIAKYGKYTLDYLVFEGGLYTEDGTELIYEEVEKKITYTDLEKGYQDITKVYNRISDNKFFEFSFMYSPNLSVDERCDKELIEVFPYTHEVTGYL